MIVNRIDPIGREMDAWFRQRAAKRRNELFFAGKKKRGVRVDPLFLSCFSKPGFPKPRLFS